MKPISLILPLATVSSVHAWGQLGHETVAYVAQSFVSSATKTWSQGILGDTSSSYLANVAAWADSYRETTAGAFSAPFHFIDAQDNPPSSCGVNYSRDCGASGCVVSAIVNYTQRVQDGRLSATNTMQALEFLIHFIGDIHQPLHDENLDVGGNDVSVTFNGTSTNLHAVWDTSIPQGYAGSNTLAHASAFATTLTSRIKTGTYKSQAPGWLTGISLNDVQGTAMSWATDANSYVCTVVIPNGVSAVAGKDLAGSYYTNALPTVEVLLARAGYRLAAWLNLIATGSTT